MNGKSAIFLIALGLLLSPSLTSKAQVKNSSKLTIKEIMAENYTGHSPKGIQWAPDSKQLFFQWNPGDAEADSAYSITPKNLSPVQVDPDLIKKSRIPRRNFNQDKSLELLNGKKGLQLVNVKKKDTTGILRTAQRISSPSFSHDGSRVVFRIDNNLYWWVIASGEFRQLTNFVEPEEKKASPKNKGKSDQDKWLEEDQKELFPKLFERRQRSSFRSYYGGGMGSGPSGMKEISLDGFSVYGIELSPDNLHVTYTLNKYPDEASPRTKMPDYVTKTGYTEIQNTRSKVGSQPSQSKLGILDLEKDSSYYLDVADLPGILDAPDYFADYPDRNTKYEEPKSARLMGPYWSEDGKYGVMVAQSFDNKDRWIIQLDLAAGKAICLDHQHDEAWIGGPGVSYGGSLGWMPDQKRIWFQSEETGYSHLYTYNLETGEKKALTNGNFEVYSPRFSKNKKNWYFYSNEVHSGERHFYTMDINGGERIQLTHLEGKNDVILSPDEKYMAITFSFANRPEELYFQQNKAGAESIQITDGRSEEFRAYNWRVPQFITFKAEDGEEVPARLYTPASNVNNKAAVIFVHGAGYLQNAHKWWSSYYHEFMFHNLLVDNGYTVLDIDYRGSAGYGRDWRTGIYRWMGGKDLSDQVDGAKYLVQEQGIDASKVGLYGGSYGGFITLMALFNAPETFAAGAALRSVTDWAHYNHGYTANILNTPVQDPIAYRKSSPIYFAEGLQGHLLMCHGMLDDNVHFQDIVRLSQRLIDLGKDNWELAVYPKQRHSFTDPDAWTDEYKRIFKLFQTTIGK